MRTLIPLLIFSCSLICCSSCKTKKKAVEPVVESVVLEKQKPNPLEGDARVLPVPEKDTTTVERLSVVFFSIGGGIDFEAKKNFEKFLADFREKHNLLLNMKKIPWGKEGEIDFCFEFDNIVPELKDELLASINEMLGKNKLVHLFKNKKCRIPTK